MVSNRRAQTSRDYKLSNKLISCRIPIVPTNATKHCKRPVYIAVDVRGWFYFLRLSGRNQNMRRTYTVALMLVMATICAQATGLENILLHPMMGLNHRDLASRLQRQNTGEKRDEPKSTADVESLKRLFSGRILPGNARFGSKNCFMSAIQCSFHYSGAHRK